MKNNITHISLGFFPGTLLMALMIFLGACSKDNDLPSGPGNPPITKIQFSQEQYQAAENGNGIQLEIELKNKAVIAGRVSVKLQSTTATYGTDYVTQPEAINGNILMPVTSGSEKVLLTIVPLNNDVRNPAREITVVLSQEESTYKPEGRIQSKVVIADDETYSLASFHETQASIFENAATGYTVFVDIEPAAAAAGFIEIELASANAVYGEHYSTMPEAENGKLRIPVQEGTGSVSFVMYGADNLFVNAKRKVSITLGNTSENIRQGTHKEMNFFIEDNDDDRSKTISQIRPMYMGTAHTFSASTRISGVVTSLNDNLDGRVMYIEDGTGGIAIRFPNRHEFNAGDVVSLELNGSRLSETNGILNISQINNGAATRIGFQTKIIPETSPVVLYQTPEIMEGRIVTLKNVQFLNADGNTPLVGDQRITDGGRQVIVRTETFASFANRIIPAGNVSVTGILVWRNNEYTIYPQKSADIR